MPAADASNNTPARPSTRWTRRKFIQTTAAGVGATAAGGAAALSIAKKTRPAPPPPAGPLRPRPGDKIVTTFCAMCGPGAGCGLHAIVRDGRFAGLKGGWKEWPLNQGRLCPKAYASPQWVYSPERIRSPLRRAGAKGEGKFEKISWDEALDTIAARLKEQKEKYGPESLAILSPAGRHYKEFMCRFLYAHGSPNFGHSGICAMQKAFSFAYTVGGSPRPDLASTKLFIIWAQQPVYSGSSKGGIKEILDAKARGVKIIAIKPSVEPDVALSDIWVPVRPGTDAALALAFLHVVINEDLYDHDFVEKWTHGFDQLVPHVRDKTPEWAERITGVPAAQIREVARLYATTRHSSISTGNGFEHATSCCDAIRAIAILMGICGHLDRPGGNLLGGGGFGRPGGLAGELGERVTQEWIDKLIGPEFPRPFQPMIEGTSSGYYRILEAVLTEKPYLPRAIMAPGTQPSVSNRGSKNVIAALKKLDFFVVIDVTRTAETDYADIVIPVTTFYESDLYFGMAGNRLMARNRVIEPLGDYKSDYEFWIELGVKMGYKKEMWDGSFENYTNQQLKPHGVTIAELRKHPLGIETKPRPRKPVYEKYAQAFAARSTRLDKGPYLPQGKLAIYQTLFAQHGFSPLPVWREPPESLTATPGLAARYPLILSDYHTSKVYNASWLRNVPFLREVTPDPFIHIHPDAARPRGIADGDWVLVESPHGTARFRAEIFPGIRPDTVMALHGWWQKCDELNKPGYLPGDGGANVNNLYSTDPEKAYDPLVTAPSSQTLVQITRLGGGAAGAAASDKYQVSSNKKNAARETRGDAGSGAEAGGGGSGGSGGGSETARLSLAAAGETARSSLAGGGAAAHLSLDTCHLSLAGAGAGTGA
ncbi:MAG: molybdopterin-dependent oxidoreductase [Opitutaceae bacterium]|jgi:anaerobic selenocysteine-containing dehydrogenase|nr:molybdopterin-dependent oxidoreductase [Opitutaceae bacterium]